MYHYTIHGNSKLCETCFVNIEGKLYFCEHDCRYG